MRFITGTAISKRPVTILAIIILLIAGVTAYNSLRVELFPDIEFPLVTVTASYPAADPEAVVRDVTAPIEGAVSGIEGLETLQSTSFEGNSILLANFTYGTDMSAAQSDVEAALGGVQLPAGADDPVVGRFSPDQIPVIYFSVVTEGNVADARDVVQSQVLPQVSGIDGVLQVQVDGEVERQVHVVVDPDSLAAYGVSLFQVASALRENNLTVPAGLILQGGQAVPVKATHTFTSLEEIESLAVGASPAGPVSLGDVAEVSLGAGAPTSISRTNGRPSVNVAIVKEAEANTIEVTAAVRDALDAADLPRGMEVVIVSDQGPDVQSQIDNLRREAIFGFLFAVAVVFAFMLTLRPTAWRGLFNTLRPTVVIGLSIPLSVFTGVLLLAWQDMTLNFMTLGGLAISVGRVVDDSIVVLENVYRHIQAGRDRWRAALEATTEVGPAIFASTLTTVVVFVPLAFIEGLVGAFFLPFALTVTFALVASLAVALTAVPVLGAYLLRPGDLPEGATGEEVHAFVQETWMQRLYTPVLRWALGHKIVTLAATTVITVASLGLIAVIPVTLFPSGGDRYLQVDVAMPPGTPPDRTLAEVVRVEDRVSGLAEVYAATVGAANLGFGGEPASLNRASILVRLSPDAPEDIANTLRNELEEPGRVLRITELADGPPTEGVEVNVTGADYAQVSAVSDQLLRSLSTVEGIVNLESDAAQERDEVSVRVDPARAAEIGLNTREVGLQLSQYLRGETVTSITLDGEATDVVLSGSPDAAASLEQVRRLVISGPGGAAPLGDLAETVTRSGPVTISRTDGVRSATITGDITEEDVQAVGRAVDERIAALSVPPGVEVSSGGVFADIAEGFQAIFLSMGVGIVLVYLVMVAFLGSLRNPLVIVTSLPLALIGALIALAITGRTLGLPAMMGVLLLIGIVVTNAIVLIAFVEQLRARGMSVYEALMTGGRVRLRPILMTALTTSFALLPLAAAPAHDGGIIGAEMATVVIGGLASSTALTLIVVPIVYTIFNDTIPALLQRRVAALFGASPG